MKKLLAIILSLVMVMSFVPSFSLSAAAETTTTEKNITLGTTALKGGQASNVYFGRYQQSSTRNTQPEGTNGVDWINSTTATKNSQGPYYKKDPIKWRVLSNADGKAFLLSDKNLDVVRYHEDYVAVTWEKSTIRSWLNGYDAASNQNSVDYSNDNFINAAFGAAEKGVIAETTVVNDDNPEYGTEGGNNTTDKVFLLSIAEAQNTSYFANDNSRKAVNTAYVYGGGKTGTSGMYGVGEADYWWLRSPGDWTRFAASVDDNGGVDYAGAGVSGVDRAVRPAFNLNLSSVLFTSAAKGGKTVSDGTVSKNADLSTLTDNDSYKLTLLDSNRHFAVSDTAAKTVKTGDTLTLSLEYTGATTGANEYISAMIVDANGAVIYYGQLAQADSASGTATLVVPSDIICGEYTLKIFNEQINGDYKTDYSSNFVDISLTVGHNYNNGICTVCGAIAPIEKNANGVYEIYVPEQLVEFAQIVNGTHATIQQDKAANAILMADIDMDGIDWTTICSTGLYYSNSYASGYGTADTGYAGTFDGDGYVIKNLSVTAIANETWTYGLFGTMTGTVKNLGIEGFTYNHNGATDMRVGAIVGQLLGGTIENCYVRNATINPGTNVAGGITGCNYAGTIKNCYVADSTVLASSSRYGYIAGDNRADTAGDRLGTIINCYTDAYPLVGSYTSTETDSRTHVSKTDFASGVITWYLNGESAEGIWKQGESYPDFTGTEVTENPINENEVPQVVDGIYQIANKSQMFYFANYVNYVDASASAVLVNDIDLESEEWTPMGNLGNAYTGTFDGKGYTISNLGMNVTEGRQIGLFGYAEGATIKNFKIDGKVVLNYEKFESCYYGVIGSVRGCTIEGIESYVDLEIKDTFAKSSIAGIVGSIEGDQTISKCAFYGTLDYGSADIDCGGGIVGYAGYNQAHVIEDCAFYGTIKSESETDDQIGGIIGYNRTAGNIMTIKNCVSAGTIDLAKTTFAGVIGGRVLGVGNTNLGYIANNYYYSANSIPAFAQTTGHTYSNIELPDYADYGDGNAKAVDVATLKSGEVTYLLNSGVTDGTQAWYQTLGEDDYPKFSGKTVYYDETETVYYNEKVKVTVDGESVETYGYIVLGTDNGDGTYSLPANVVGYYMDDSFVDAGKYAVVGSEVITTVNFNVTMVNGAQVRYGGGLDENGKVSAGNGLRFLATVDRSEFDGIGYGMKLTAEGSSAETIVNAEKWQSDDVTFTVAITDMAESNYIRKFTATPFVKVKYADGTEKTIYGTETVTRSIYQVAAGLLKDETQTAYGLVDVLNAYANQTGIRLVVKDGELKANTSYTTKGAYELTEDELHFAVSDAAYDEAGNAYSVILTAQGNAEIITEGDFWKEYIRINNNNSLVKDKITVEPVPGNDKAVKVTFAADGLIERPTDTNDNTTPDPGDDGYDPETGM